MTNMTLTGKMAAIKKNLGHNFRRVAHLYIPIPNLWPHEFLV